MSTTRPHMYTFQIVFMFVLLLCVTIFFKKDKLVQWKRIFLWKTEFSKRHASFTCPLIFYHLYIRKTENYYGYLIVPTKKFWIINLNVTIVPFFILFSNKYIIKLKANPVYIKFIVIFYSTLNFVCNTL